MSATKSYRFFEFLLRPAGAVATDALLARQWTEADPWHRDHVQPAFWLEQDADKDSYILFDKEGPVFFWKGVRMGTTIEMHIQFPPRASNRAERRRQHHRVSAGLIVGLTWLEGMLSRSGVEEIRFDSENPALMEFAVKTLRFGQDGLRLSKRLAPLSETQERQNGALERPERVV